jgi:hypothetical protein
MKFDQNSLMILLRKEGAHGVSARFEKVRMLLPERSYESPIAPLLQAKLTLLAQCEVSDVIYYNSKFVISRNLPLPHNPLQGSTVTLCHRASLSAHPATSIPDSAT